MSLFCPTHGQHLYRALVAFQGARIAKKDERQPRESKERLILGILFLLMLGSGIYAEVIR